MIVKSESNQETLGKYRRNMQDAQEDTMNVMRIGVSLCQSICFQFFTVTMIDPDIASIPDSVVASPYEGRRYGNHAIVNTPKPKPHTRSTKAPMRLSMNISIASVISSLYLLYICRVKPEFRQQRISNRTFHPGRGMTSQLLLQESANCKLRPCLQGCNSASM